MSQGDYLTCVVCNKKTIYDADLPYKATLKYGKMLHDIVTICKSCSKKYVLTTAKRTNECQLRQATFLNKIEEEAKAEQMKHKDKIKWMQEWSKKNSAILDLEGVCGFGKECVGILINGIYPDYNSFDDNYKRIDKNGYVWTPYDAYHKHPCVAVLGRGKEAENQLYQWLMWFDDNNFCIEYGEIQGSFDEIELMLCKNVYAKMTKLSEVSYNHVLRRNANSLQKEKEEKKV